MHTFRSKVAIVTGGASGIGRAICEELGRAGATVVVADIDAAGAEDAASAVVALGGNGYHAVVNVAEEQAVQHLVETTVVRRGCLDYMFNNAGVCVWGEVRDMNGEHWRRVLDVNLSGVIYGTRSAYRAMLAQGSGHIVNTASVVGLVPSPLAVPYVTAKYAVVGLSTSLRHEAAAHGVRVSVICPGLVRTRFYETVSVLNAQREDALSVLPAPLMPVTRAARAMLRGVRRNRAIIVFPWHARFAWWLHRLQPALLDPAMRRAVRRFRRISSRPR